MQFSLLLYTEYNIRHISVEELIIAGNFSPSPTYPSHQHRDVKHRQATTITSAVTSQDNKRKKPVTFSQLSRNLHGT